ncbi:hypothetical protein ACTEPI_001692 [Cronobacter turicensis]
MVPLLVTAKLTGALSIMPAPKITANRRVFIVFILKLSTEVTLCRTGMTT